MVKNPPANSGDAGSVLGPERCHVEGNGNPLQYSFLGSLMDREVWQTTVCWFPMSWTQLFFLSCVLSCLKLCDAMDCTHQSPLSMEFSRQKYWSRLPFPTLGDLPNPRIEPESLVFPAWAGGFFFFTTVPPGKPYKCFSSVQSLSRVQLFAAP